MAQPARCRPVTGHRIFYRERESNLADELMSPEADAAAVALKPDIKADFDKARDVFIAGMFGIGGTLLGWILAKIF